MKTKFTSIILFSVLFLFSPVIHAAESISDVLKETKMLYKNAAKLQGAWVTTGKLIKKAEAALKKGDKSTATKLANKARTEAKLSIAQAEEQAKNWTEPSYIER